MLAFIRRARELGFELGDVRSLLELADHPEQACAEAAANLQCYLRCRSGSFSAVEEGTRARCTLSRS